MKLLALITDGFGANGGIAQYNRDLMLALAQSSSVTNVLALPRRGGMDATTPPKVSQLAASSGPAAFSARALLLAVQQRFDAVFCGHIYAAPLASVLSRLLRKPLWLQVHGIEAWQRPSATVRNAAASASLITSVSRHTRRRLLDWCDIAPERVRVLPNTVSANYRPRPRRADLAARHALAGRKVLLTVGRLSAGERYKGHDRVMAALPRIAEQQPDVCYLIVGDGDDLPRLRHDAETKGLSNRVVFAGHVPESEIADYFALADVFAMPSTGEGFGIVFLEAAASGLPVIGGNRDGSVDALADGRVGRVVDPDDIESISDAIIAALDGRLRPDTAAASRFAFDNFSRHVDDIVRRHL
jgi:phosphatidylinositol alpha-1,6-mannosyltransferase